MKKYFLSILVMTAAIFFGCVEKPRPTLKVGTNVWPGYEFLYLARNLGYYEGTPVKLVEYPSASEVIQAYHSGAIEAATLTMDEVFLLAEREGNPRIALIMDFSRGGDAVLGRPGIQGLADLKGRRVGVEANALGAFMLTRSLDSMGMNTRDVEIVRLEADKHEDAFKKGDVDAIVTFEPARSRLLSQGAVLLFDSSQIPNEIVDVLIVREDYLANRSDIVETLLKGWFQALDYFNKYPEKAARMMAPREGVSPEQFLSSLQGLHIPDRKENLEQLAENGSLVSKAMRRLVQVMVDANLLSRKMDPLPFVDAGPLKRIK